MNLLTKIWYQKPQYCHPEYNEGSQNTSSKSKMRSLSTFGMARLLGITALFYALVPFSAVYRFVIFSKKLIYQFKLKKITYFPVPIIVIGNLTVGGTGKTPLIIALTHFLLEKNYKPGIVSRGYGGKPTKLPLHVNPNSDPAQAGDEPVLIARKTHCPVIVDKNRVRAVQTLLDTYDCDVVLSDDGLQHTALGRHIEIVVIDGIRRFGNNFCLPAGPLREPITRLKKVDFIVTRDGHALSKEWPMRLIPNKLLNLVEPNRLFPTTYDTKTIHAVTGIGNPQFFFHQLREMGFSIIEHAFPDHHIYKPKDIAFGENAIVIMTEKDAVKCQEFAQAQHWCLPVFADCDPMFEQLLEKLNQIKFLRH